MATSDEFKQELRQENLTAHNIRNAMKLALSKAIELNITTRVVEDDDTEEEVASGKPGYRMCTRINIVDGDIENEVGSEFIGAGAYTELREFHLDQVQEGQDIIHHNLISLQHLFGILATTLRQLPVGHPEWSDRSTHPQNEFLP